MGVVESMALLPLEIRDPQTGDLVERTVIRSLQQKLSDLGQGEWLVSIALPSGRHLSQTISTDAAGRIDTADLTGKLVGLAGEKLAGMVPAIARIGRDVHEGLPGLARVVFKDIDWKRIVGNVAGLAVEKSIGPLLGSSETISPPSSFGPAHSLRHPDARLRFFRGSVLKGELAEITREQVKVEKVEDSVHISDFAGKLLIVQLLRPDLPTSNLLLPPGSVLRLSRQTRVDSAAVVIAIQFGDALVDQAVSLRAGASLSDLVTVAGNLTTDDVRAFGAKPTGAAVCLLYLILRARVEMVELAIQSLSTEAVKTPDAAVVKAELAARLGHHEKALTGFLEAAELGLPLFGQGVTYLSDRLNLYKKMFGSQQQNLAAAATVETVLNKLDPFSANCDYSAPVTTYSGPHPAKPGSTPLGRAEFVRMKGFAISLS
jgi:hypothetical protein